MKNKILIFTFLSITLFFNCKKKEEVGRLNGDWQFHYSYFSWNVSSGVVPPSGSGDYVGTISQPHLTDSKFKIQFCPDISDECTIKNDTSFYGCGTSGLIQDNAHITLTYYTNHCYGSMGGGTNYTVSGVKK